MTSLTPCAACGKTFSLERKDGIFLERISPTIEGKKNQIPPPRLCPECRRQRRMAWRKERYLFRRACDRCKKSVVSMYAAEAPYQVYCPSCFWSDSWSPLEYGQKIDFSRPIFDQFQNLLSRTPLISLINVNSENSEYCHRIYDGRDNYLSFIALYAPENLIHTYYTQSCKSSIDISVCQKVELGYELTDSENSYNCRYSRRIQNCFDSYFLEDCVGCSHCFGCKNLHQKAFCVFNEQLTKESYAAFLSKARLNCWRSIEDYRNKAESFLKTLPSRNLTILRSENVTGTNIFNSKNCAEGFDLYECEETRYMGFAEKCHNCLDCYGFGASQHCYESVTLQGSHSCLFCATAIGCSDLLYCYDCYSDTNNCFASCGLKKGTYCILNKQYSRYDYEKLKAKIITHMQDTGEWGEFFPISMSPFCYNESDVQGEFPLSETAATALGYRWLADVDRFPTVVSSIPAESIPDAIEDVEDSIVDKALICSRSGRPFRIVKQELDFYRSQGIPIPHMHPEERHKDRIVRRAMRARWERKCDRCHQLKLSAYSPESDDIVFCQECYRSEVF